MPSGEVFRRRRLPHWDVPGATYFVTACLAGSIPAQGLLEIERLRRHLNQQPRPPQLSTEEWTLHRWKLVFACSDRWLDRKPGVRHLADPLLAAEVVKAIYHFAGQRYDVLAYIVMPSHMHWVFRPRDEWVQSLDTTGRKPTPRQRIMHSLKRHSGLQCNHLLGRQGAFWQDESYDHCVRDADELERIIHYVERNPVTAGLIEFREDWPYSSSSDRAKWDIPFGHPLIRPRDWNA